MSENAKMHTRSNSMKKYESKQIIKRLGVLTLKCLSY